MAADHFLVTPQGTRYQDLIPGMGAAAESGDVVTMHFVVWLGADGSKGREVYNSRREREPVSFVAGTDSVMQGWSDGLIGMRPGGKRKLMLPPGICVWIKGGGEGVIPPDARLIFTLDLVAIE